MRHGARRTGRGWALAGLLVVAACADGLTTGADDVKDVTAADVVGTYDLVQVGSACDVMINGRVKEGGTFTATSVAGTMTLAPGNSATHDFAISGTCRFDDGTAVPIGSRWRDRGTYEFVGGGAVRLEHQGVACTGTFRDGGFTVRTGTLAPPVRFTYTLRKRVSPA